MSRIISRNELQNMTNDDLMKITKDRAVEFYKNGIEYPKIQLSPNDLEGFDMGNSLLFTKTNIRIDLQEIDYMKIL